MQTAAIELHQQKHEENPATWTEKLEKQQNPHKSPVSLLYNNPQFILHPDASSSLFGQRAEGNGTTRSPLL